MQWVNDLGSPVTPAWPTDAFVNARGQARASITQRASRTQSHSACSCFNMAPPNIRRCAFTPVGHLVFLNIAPQRGRSAPPPPLLVWRAESTGRHPYACPPAISVRRSPEKAHASCHHLVVDVKCARSMSIGGLISTLMPSFLPRIRCRPGYAFWQCLALREHVYRNSLVRDCSRDVRRSRRASDAGADARVIGRPVSGEFDGIAAVPTGRSP